MTNSASNRLTFVNSLLCFVLGLFVAVQVNRPATAAGAGGDNFANERVMLGSPAAGAAAVTPSDSTDLTTTSRGIYIGGAGDIAVNMGDGGATVTFKAANAGTVLPIRAKRVMSTNTTATNIVELY